MTTHFLRRANRECPIELVARPGGTTAILSDETARRLLVDLVGAAKDLDIFDVATVRLTVRAAETGNEFPFITTARGAWIAIADIASWVAMRLPAEEVR